jgi:uncharacterized protein with beta-barrel porin domain
MAYRILLRRDNSANWSENNPVLALGEPGYETDTGKLKVGDGSTAWNSLTEINPTGVTGPTGSVDFTSIASNVTPSTDSTYSLGSLSFKWSDLYLGGSLYLGDSSTSIEGSNGNVIITGSTGNQIVGDLTVTGTTNIRPYKVYSALLTQTSSSNPAATVLHTTFDDTLTWERSYTGRYTVSSSSEFTEDKIFVIFSQNAAIGTSTTPCHYNWQWYDVDTLIIESLNSAGATADNLLTSTSVEIRVYD